MSKSFSHRCVYPLAAATITLLSLGSAHAANITWIGPTGSFWDVAANWSSRLPGAGDDILLGGFDTTFRSGTVSIGSFTGTGKLYFTSGQLSVANASFIDQLEMANGSLGGSGNVTIKRSAELRFGDMRGAATTILQGETRIGNGGGNGLRLDGGRVLRNESNLTWVGGSLDLNNTVNGGSIAGSGTINNLGFFTVSGAATGNIGASNYGGIDTGADAAFNNSGTFLNAGSSAAQITTVSVAFNNSGRVKVDSGILSLSNGGTHTGMFDVESGGVLAFGGGTHSFAAGTSTLTSLGTVRVSSAIVNLNADYNIAGTTDLRGGTLNLLSGNASTSVLNQSGGSLNGNNSFTVTGVSTITYGDHRGTGTTILRGFSTIGGSGFRLDGGRVLRNERQLTWDGGVLDLNNIVSGNAVAGVGTINNAPNSTFIVSGDAANTITASNFGGSDTGANAAFNNSGIVRKDGSSATHTTTVSVAFNNERQGQVEVRTGILNLTNGGTQDGSFDVSAGSVLAFGGGTHNITQFSSVAAAGTVRVSSGVVNLNTDYNIAGTTDLRGGTLNLLSGDSSTGVLTQSGGSLNGVNNFTVAGASTITDGDHRGAGTTILQGPSSIGGNGFRLDGGRVLRNESTLTWNGGFLDLNSNVNGVTAVGSGAINNAVGATFIAKGDGSRTTISASNQRPADTGADAAFNNAGTFRKTGSNAAHTTTVDVLFNNSGTVQVQSGILAFSKGSTHTGSVDVAAGSVLWFRSPNNTENFNAGSSLTALGTVRVSGLVNMNVAYNVAGATELLGGTLTLLNGNASTGAFTQTSGVLRGDNNLTVAGASTINNGDHRGAGTTILQGPSSIGGVFNLDGGRVLRNENTLTWNGGALRLNDNSILSLLAGSGTINNVAGATFIANGFANSISARNAGGSDTGADASFNNAGTFRKTGSAASHVTNVDVTLNNTGKIEVLTGTLAVSKAFDNQGTITTANGATFYGNNNDFTNSGRIDGDGTVRTALNNDLLNQGVIGPGVGIGTLTIDGDLTMAAPSRTQIQLTSLTSFDKLTITKAALVGGTLEILNLGYTPVLGDSFKIVTFNQRLSNSAFSNLTWSGFNADVVFAATYNLNDVTLSVAAVPEPSTWALCMIGVALVGGIATRRGKCDEA